MTVQDIYEVIEKNSEYTMSIIAESNDIMLAYCNGEAPCSWESIHDAIKQLKVTKLIPERRHSVICVEVDITATYQSKEHCIMDGYEKLVESNKGPLYVKETFVENGYEGRTESTRYVFAVVEGYI